MSCPICGELCRCAEPRTYASRTITLAEVDDYDPSEEQFASSLAGRDSYDEEEVQELSSGSLSSARQKSVRELPDIPMDPQPDLLLTKTPSPEETWREAVSSRIQNYKARRRRSLGGESLSFNFESTAGNHVFLQPEAKPEPVASVSPEPEAAPAYYAPYATAHAIEPADSFGQHVAEYLAHSEATAVEVEGLPIVVPEPPKPAPIPETAKLIFFPKPPMMQTAPADQLAEPVFDVPRIVEAAPEEIEPVTVPLADITLQPDPMEDAIGYVESFFELPMPVAPAGQRVFGELVDCCVVLLATGIFAIIASRLGAESMLQDKRSLLGMAVLVPAMLWSVYKYVFLVHGEATPGMQAAKVRLVDFDGNSPRKGPRRYRALAMLVSAFPLGLGLMWSFVDTEALCWHDRISKTYVTQK